MLLRRMGLTYNVAMLAIIPLTLLKIFVGMPIEALIRRLVEMSPQLHWYFYLAEEMKNDSQRR